MKRFFLITLFAAVFVGAMLLTLFVKTTTANADIAAGNQAYTAKNYDTALQRYTAAQSQAPGQVEPVYDAANTYYRQNVLDKAQQALEQTLAQPQNAIAEFVRFNLGNIAYLAKQFDAAIAQYEEALRLQPNDGDAKYNLELALQQKQQQDQQQQQNKDQQKQQDQQQNQDQKNQQDQSQNQDQQKQDQQKPQDQQNQSGGPQDQPQQQQQDQQNGQRGGQQNQQQNQPDQQNQQQGQQAGQPDQQQPDQQNGQAAGAQPQKGLTPEQARRLLAVIGGNSKTLMEQLQQTFIVPGGNPDKDW